MQSTLWEDWLPLESTLRKEAFRCVDLKRIISHAKRLNQNTDPPTKGATSGMRFG